MGWSGNPGCSCRGWPCGSTVFPGEKWVVWYEGEKDLHCDVIHCDVTRRDRPTCSENLRQGSVNMRSHFSYRVRRQLAHLSLCCAWAVFQVRDENENVPFVWNWSHCYLYETPFFQIQAQKKAGLDFPFEKPEVIDAGPWVDKTGLSTSSRMGFAKISKLRISINRKIFLLQTKIKQYSLTATSTQIINTHYLTIYRQTCAYACMDGCLLVNMHIYICIHTHSTYINTYTSQ